MSRFTIYQIILILGMIVTACGAFTSSTINGAALAFAALAYLLCRSHYAPLDTNA